LVRGLAARTKGGHAPAAQVIDRGEMLTELGISSDELILIGLIVGTDFNDGAAGYGPKKALKLVQQHLGWEETLKKVGIDPAEVQPVAELFRHPEVVDIAVPPFGPVDDGAVDRLLVETHGFSPERVRAAIAKARSRPSPSSSPIDLRGRQTLLDAYGGNEA
jgi:flap endonuclease-1